MDIEEFRKHFIDDIRFQAEHEGADPESVFIEKSLTILEELGELNDPMPMSVELRNNKNQRMSFDAYSYDEADNALVLISSVFYNERDSKPNLAEGGVNDILGYMQNFISEVNKGNISKYCDESDGVIQVAKEIKGKMGKGMITTEILRFKFLIITNATLYHNVKNLSRPDFLERPVDLNVWTLERFYQNYISNTSEVLEINTKDFNCNGIQYLRADIGDYMERDKEKKIDAENEEQKIKCDVYLGIVPGKFLADIYVKYGSKLLQGNIRAFLKVTGKVNKGIRKTIAEKPSNFFTYNNGIAVVARSVTFSADKSRIISFKDFQIINGGQTTASLANAVIKHEAKKGMNTLFVPMKLTVLNMGDDMSKEEVEIYNEVTEKISKCANCQNPVTAADFFSNHPFHVLMETLSQKVMAPPVNGMPYQTIWYYERTKNKWDQEQFKMNDKQKRQFSEKYPKSQVIKKEKLAKCYNTILMNPHQVCQSSAINFSRFADFVDDMYENHRDNINEEFFKKCVCSVIMFDTLDKLINKASWYPTGGNKAQIVPYTISKLMKMLPKDKDIDWITIWQKQMLYPELAEELMKLAYVTHTYLENRAGGGLVRTISRTTAVWRDFQDYPYNLSEKFIQKLASKSETHTIEQAAKKIRKFNANVDVAVEVFNLGTKYWMKVYDDLMYETVLSYGDCSFIKGIADCIGRNSLPTTAQCQRLMKIVSKAEDKGYIMS